MSFLGYFENMRQIDSDECLMATAALWGLRSHSKRKRVGAVISSEGRIVSIGYNGTLPDHDNCCEDENGVTKSTVLHAEENALSHCLRHGISVKDSTLHVTLAPCEHCACMIIYAGIKEVVYMEKYRSTAGLELLEAEKDILVRQFILDGYYDTV